MDTRQAEAAEIGVISQATRYGQREGNDQYQQEQRRRGQRDHNPADPGAPAKLTPLLSMPEAEDAIPTAEAIRPLWHVRAAVTLLRTLWRGKLIGRAGSILPIGGTGCAGRILPTGLIHGLCLPHPHAAHRAAPHP